MKHAPITLCAVLTGLLLIIRVADAQNSKSQFVYLMPPPQESHHTVVMGDTNAKDPEVAGHPLLVGRRNAPIASRQSTPPTVGEQKSSRSRYQTFFRAAGHLVKSHTFELVKQPFTSAGRLVCLFGDTAFGLINRADIRFRCQPVLARTLVPPNLSTDAMDLAVWESELDRMTGRPAIEGRICYLIDGPAFFSALESAVQNAKSSVHMQTYIYADDDVAMKFADLLMAQSHALDVRILYDGLGTIMAQGVAAESLPFGYDAPRCVHRYIENNSRAKVRVISNTWLTSDHIKNTIIDGQRAFIGGMNVGREYRHEWHDMMIELEGPVVRELGTMFDLAWARAGIQGDLGFIRHARSNRPACDRRATYPVRLITTRTGRPHLSNVLKAAVKRAQKYVFLENAYVADDAMILELCRARKRGVDVRVVLPEKTNHSVMQHNNKIAEQTLLAHGVRVFRYPGMTHIKAIVVDGWACLGTANFYKLSFHVNLELNVATSDETAVNELIDQLFLKDMCVASEILFPETLGVKDYVLELVADEL